MLQLPIELIVEIIQYVQYDLANLYSLEHTCKKLMQIIRGFEWDCVIHEDTRHGIIKHVFLNYQFRNLSVIFCRTELAMLCKTKNLFVYICNFKIFECENILKKFVGELGYKSCDTVIFNKKYKRGYENAHGYKINDDCSIEKIECLDTDACQKLFDPVSKIIDDINNTEYSPRLGLETSHRYPAKITEHRFNWISKLIRSKKYIDEIKIAVENSKKSKKRMLTVREEYYKSDYYYPRFHSGFKSLCNIMQIVTYKSDSEIQAAEMCNLVHQQKHKQLADKRKNKWSVMKHNQPIQKNIRTDVNFDLV